MLVSKGAKNMVQKRDEWVFFRLRAAQLYEEGKIDSALSLLETLHAQQAERFAMAEEEYEQTENC